MQIKWKKTDLDISIKELISDESVVQELETVCSYLNAPSTVKGFSLASETFASILPLLNNFFDEDENHFIVNSLASISARTYPESVAKNMRSASYHGFCKIRPIYVLLMVAPTSKAPAHAKNLLISCFYVQFIKNYDRMSSQVMEECCRAVRHVLNKSSFQSNDDFYDLYKIDFSDAKMAVNELQNFIEEHVLLNKRNISCIEEVKRVFDNSVGSSHEGGISRELGLRQIRQATFESQNIQTNVLENSGLEDDDEYRGRIEVLFDRSEEIRKVVKELGISLEEAQSEAPVIFEPVNSSKAQFEHDPLALKFRAEGKSNGIRRGNQYLAHSWSDLNNRELFVLFKELLCINDAQSSIKNVPTHVVAYYTLSILLRGNPIEHIIKTRVVKRRYKSLNNCLLVADKNKLQFIINGWLYNQGRKATRGMYGKVLPIDQRHQVLLEVPSWAVDIMLTFVDKKEHHRYWSKGEVSPSIRFWLTKINNKYPECHLNLQKLESFLVSYSMESKFDLAESAYCHCNPQPAQAMQLYYTAVSIRRVNFIYRNYSAPLSLALY